MIFLTNKKLWLLLFNTILWFLVAGFDIFNTFPKNWLYTFELGEKWSSSDIAGELIIRVDYPELDTDKFLQRADVRTNRNYLHQNDLEYYQLLTNKQTKTYSSHLGTQADILYPLWAMIDVLFSDSKDKYWYAYRLSELFTILLTALTLSLFFMFLSVEFGVFPVLITSIIMSLSAFPLINLMKNLFFMLWPLFIPILISMYYLYKYDGKKLKQLGILLFISIAFKLSMGYEYSTNMMIATVTPIFYIAYTRSWSKEKFFKVLFFIGLTIVMAFCSIVIIHGLIAGIDVLMERLLLRANSSVSWLCSPTNSNSAWDKECLQTTINYIKYIFTPTYPLIMNIIYYLYIYRLIIFFIKNTLFYRGQFKKVIDAIDIGFTITKKQYLGLLIVLFFSFMSSVSLIVVFINHYLEHGFDQVTWSLFYLIFLILFVCYKPSTLKQ